MSTLDQMEVALVQEAVAACAEEHEDQLTGRKVAKGLLDWIYEQLKNGVPMYTILVALWVTTVQLSEEWRDAKDERITE